MNIIFKKVKSSIPNLHIAYYGDNEIGMIDRPRNTKCDKNYWRCYVGVGFNTKFIGHAIDRKNAEKLVTSTYLFSRI